MSQVVVNVTDQQQAIHIEADGGLASAIVGAISADPATICELETALGRFHAGRRLLADAPSGIQTPEGPWLLVDLFGRLVSTLNLPDEPLPSGKARYQAPLAADDEIWLPFEWAAGWELCAADTWRLQSQSRRAARLAAAPTDTRRVLYDDLIEFVAHECCRAGRAVREAADLHAKWLTTEHSGLALRTPREALLQSRCAIDRDIEFQAIHWARLGEAPPGLPRESAAFQFSGYGTHENVLYYELVRTLLVESLRRAQTGRRTEADEQRHLGQLKQEWMHTPQEELYGHSPAEVIARERARLPMGMAAEHTVLDDDCPLCQMLREIGGPVFWHLDGAHMDDDFAFSFHTSREEWEEEQRRWREFAESARETGNSADSLALPPDNRQPPPPAESMGELPAVVSSEVALFRVGARLAELTSQLTADWQRTHCRSLCDQFANLRQAVRDTTWCLVEPIIDRMCEELQEVSARCPDHVERCAAVERELHEFSMFCNQ